MKKMLIVLFSIVLSACGVRTITVDSGHGTKDTSVPPPAASSAPIPTPMVSSSAGPVSWSVHFSPHGGCTEEVVKIIDAAKSSVWVQAYGFTSGPVADALVRAYARHNSDGKPLDIRVILDKSNRTEQSSKISELTKAHVPTWIDAKHAIAHNKIVIVDGHVVETGSFNYTGAAENSNAENCLVLDDAEMAAAYQTNWISHKDHSDPAE